MICRYNPCGICPCKSEETQGFCTAERKERNASHREIIKGSQYEDIRGLYRLAFVRDDYSTVQYWKKEDSWFGSFYIWDYLKEYNRCSEHYCLETIKGKNLLYVMWDTSEGDLSQDYEVYPKKSILRMTASEFFGTYKSLPEDLYIFDDRYDWTVILTHEEYRKNKRYCLHISSK